MRKPTTSHSEIRDFMKRFYGGPSKAAVYIGVHYTTIYRWEENPEQMLSYSFKIRDTSDATHDDIAKAVERQLEMNVPKE